MAPSKSSKRKGNRQKKELTPQDHVVSAFMGCARCSFFLAGYRLIFDDFDEAVDKSEEGILNLSWNHAVKQLVQSSYGRQIEQDAYHLMGSCQECRRAFVYEQNGESGKLRIAIKNRP